MALISANVTAQDVVCPDNMEYLQIYLFKYQLLQKELNGEHALF